MARLQMQILPVELNTKSDSLYVSETLINKGYDLHEFMFTGIKVISKIKNNPEVEKLLTIINNNRSPKLIDPLN